LTRGGDDGRFIDPSAGELTGEAATQEISVRNADVAVYAGVPAVAPDPTYYDVPMLKEPVWIWSVPAYMHVGGVAGAASTLGAALQVSGNRRLRRLVRRCHWIAAVGTGLGALLLVEDLGRKSRFLNMLRVFRPTSPLSVGSWVLAGSSGLSGAAVLLDGTPMGDMAGLGAGLLGPPLATYTAVLLSHTAVPVWNEVRRELPFLFAASAVAGAASILELMPLDPGEAEVVGRFGTAGRAAELVAARLVQRRAGRMSEVGRALEEGRAGALWKASELLTFGSLVAGVAGRVTGRRPARVTAGVLGTAGGLALRFSLLKAGVASTRDPRAAFHQQRRNGSPTPH
jgi:formate-dependent nitrite reductase membrane component NrfD